VKAVANLVLWTAIALYTFVGLTGVLFGPYELGSSLPHNGAIDPSVFSQIRFFKALELSMGIAFFALRRRVHDDPFAQRFVVFVLWSTPLARIVSMVADGLPSLQFRALTVVELLGAIVFTIYSLRSLPFTRALPPTAAHRRRT
jgi:hypothetical protein